MIGRSGERGSGISVQPARHDDDDDFIKIFYLTVLNCSVVHESDKFCKIKLICHKCF